MSIERCAEAPAARQVMMIRVEKKIGRGFAGRPYDNVGVQYGLRALFAGDISPAQFVDLNAKVGGVDIDYAGQPMFGVGTDPFGTYAAGGVSFLFSDTLGNHVLATSVQVTNRFDEFGGQLFYLNRTHRWNWGVGVDQTPYISSAFATGFDTVNGQNVYIEREYRIKQIDRGFSGLISYPFNAARRVEFS